MTATIVIQSSISTNFLKVNISIIDAANTMKSKSSYAEGRVGGDKLESKIKAIAAKVTYQRR